MIQDFVRTPTFPPHPLLAIVYAAHQMTKDKVLESLHAQLAEFHPERKKLSCRTNRELVLTVLVFHVPK